MLKKNFFKGIYGLTSLAQFLVWKCPTPGEFRLKVVHICPSMTRVTNAW